MVETCHKQGVSYQKISDKKEALVRTIFKPGNVARMLEERRGLERAYPDIVTVHFHPVSAEAEPVVLVSSVLDELRRYFEREGSAFFREDREFVSVLGITTPFSTFRVIRDGIAEYRGNVMSGHLPGATLPIVSVTWYEVADVPREVRALLDELPVNRAEWRRFLLDMIPEAVAHQPSHASPSGMGSEFGVQFTDGSGVTIFAAFWSDGTAVLYEHRVGNAELHGTWRRIILELLMRSRSIGAM